MARKNTAIPESALMEAFEQGRLVAWSSAYDAGYENGYMAGQSDLAYAADYARGRADAADSFADWLDTLPADVYDVLRPHLVRALAGVLSDQPPF